MTQKPAHKEEHHWITISEEEYKSMQSTIDVLADSDLVKQLVESKEARSKGQVSSLDEVKKRLGF